MWFKVGVCGDYSEFGSGFTGLKPCRLFQGGDGWVIGKY